MADGRVVTVAAKHGVRPAQVSLAWTLHRAPNVLAIAGTGNREHPERNAAAAALRLSGEELAHAYTLDDPRMSCR